jgi:hypothetical protein
MGFITTCFGPKGPSSRNIHISEITGKIHWVVGSLCKNEISFVQITGLCSRVIRVCVNVFFSL